MQDEELLDETRQRMLSLLSDMLKKADGNEEALAVVNSALTVALEIMYSTMTSHSHAETLLDMCKDEALKNVRSVRHFSVRPQ